MADFLPSADSTEAAPPDAGGATPAPDASADNSSAQWLARIEKCKTKRRQLLVEWTKNVDYRRGKQLDTESDSERIAIPTDWSQTKAKQAQLFSQVPQVQLSADNAVYKPAMPPFQKRLNDHIKKAKVGTSMDEVLPDCINAAGIGAVILSYEARTRNVEMPEIDLTTLPPEEAQLYQQGVKQMPMRTVPKVLDSRFLCERVSPEDLLWDVEFTGSDFDDSSWIGRNGRTTWAHGAALFNLTEDQKATVLGSGERTSRDRLVPDAEHASADAETVNFSEIFYWDYRFNTEFTSYKAIHRLVFVDGLTEPVVNEPWTGQRFDPQTGAFVGANHFPIRVLTLTYVSNEPIPPSDSAIGRPQVDELMKSRSQMVQQRDHSRPVRWMDVNRIDPAIATSLMQGDWQQFIPTNGDGGRAIGEVARTAYPRENMDFDRTIKQDLSEAWQVGPNQMGTTAAGEKSASEANIVQANFQTRIGYERSRCVAFFVGIAEVLAGLIVLFDPMEPPTVSEGEMEGLQAWDRTRVNQEMVFSVRADSTVLLDSQQRLKRLENFLNMTGASQYVNPKPIIEEMAALSGIDPAEVIQDPNPKGPEPPQISFRFSGASDLMNPAALAMLLQMDLGPKPESLEAAFKLLQEILDKNPAAPLVPQKPGDTLVAKPDVVQNPAVLPAPPEPPPMEPPPMGPDGGPAPPMQDDRPEWEMIDQINTRRQGE